MKLLIDTHVFLWWITGDTRLSAAARAAVLDPGNEVFLSVVSEWECLVKHAIGKLTLPTPPERYLISQRQRYLFATLPLDEESVARLPSLPPHHRDPFDRMLVCQAERHGMSIVTVDPAVAAYGVPCIR